MNSDVLLMFVRWYRHHVCRNTFGGNAASTSPLQEHVIRAQTYPSRYMTGFAGLEAVRPRLLCHIGFDTLQQSILSRQKVLLLLLIRAKRFRQFLFILFSL